MHTISATVRTISATLTCNVSYRTYNVSYCCDMECQVLYIQYQLQYVQKRMQYHVLRVYTMPATACSVFVSRFLLPRCHGTYPMACCLLLYVAVCCMRYADRRFPFAVSSLSVYFFSGSLSPPTSTLHGYSSVALTMVV